MAENKEGQEKTEPASAKRITDARLRGQVAKSMDVTSAVVLLFGSLAVFLFGGLIASKMQNLMKEIFSNSSTIQVTFQNVGGYYENLIVLLGLMLLPIIVSIFVVVLISEIAQVGLVVATKKFSEGSNFKRIFSVFSGLKRIFFSGRSAFELLKGVLKILILGSVVYQVIDSHADETIGLIERPFTDITALMVSVSLEMILKVAIVYIIIAMGDYMYQKYRYKEDLKMTMQEVKEEHKQMEGDPKVKARIRSLMRQRIRKLMLQNVKTADVVITNPTHIAVALAYKQGIMNAPRLIAKGVDYLAIEIRRLAEEADVPIVEQPPLARALYYSVDVEQEIPENLFKAVAQILAYIYYLKRRYN